MKDTYKESWDSLKRKLKADIGSELLTLVQNEETVGVIEENLYDIALRFHFAKPVCPHPTIREIFERYECNDCGQLFIDKP